jgi:pimeloyl-ACP methyl ester carboxylesterase
LAVPTLPETPTAEARRPLVRFLANAVRLVPVAIAVALLAASCANRGFDEDPVAESEPDTGAGSGDASGGEGDGAVEATDPGDVETGDLPVGAVVDPAALASIEETACSFDELAPLPRTPTCYTVSVPENWQAPDPDDRVLLQVAVFPADAPPAENVATIYLDGGPGGYTLDLLWTSFGQLHDGQVGERDYIVFDQRGVGTSEPALDCPELADVESDRLTGRLAPEDESDVTLAATDACRTRLESSGVDLTAYNSVASANDVEAIRSLLDYDQMNLLGVSYGTRLAQTVMRLYPDSVRAAVLDSIVPVESDLWTNFAPEAKRAFEQLFRGCAEDPACAAASPDLENRFFALLDQLDAAPIEVEFTDLLEGGELTAIVDGDELMGLVFSALYDRSMFSLIPMMVGEVEAGDHGTVEFLGSIEVTNYPYLSTGQYLSVECNEELAFEDEASLARLAPTEDGYDRLADVEGDVTLFDQCRHWAAGSAPEAESQPVVSDIPTLLLGGRYDPITRPTNTDIVAAGLANSFTFVFPDEGHGILSTECGSQLVAEFLDRPDVEPDGSCIATSPAPLWVAPEGVEVELVAFAIDEPFVVSGLRPDGWLDAGNGVFARQYTAKDPTSLIVQPTGGIVASFIVDLLESQLGLTFEEGPAIEAGGRSWAAYRSDEDPDQAVRLAVSRGDDGVMVVLVATAEEIDALEPSVFLPALEAATAG